MTLWDKVWLVGGVCLAYFALISLLGGVAYAVALALRWSEKGGPK